VYVYFHSLSNPRVELPLLAQLEMDIPKILWLKNHMKPSVFSNCQFFDLPDYLTYRATGSPARSCCSLTSKYSFIPRVGWKREFFGAIGLGEFCETTYRQIGAEDDEQGVRTVGMPVGRGLERKAAEDLGLMEGTPVGSALIDAYVHFVWLAFLSFD
jgi:ribulose kinase